MAFFKVLCLIILGPPTRQLILKHDAANHRPDINGLYADTHPGRPVSPAGCRYIFMHCSESTTLRGDTATFVSNLQRYLLLTYENFMLQNHYPVND
jgi:hypothetical protein